MSLSQGGRFLVTWSHGGAIEFKTLTLRRVAFAEGGDERHSLYRLPMLPLILWCSELRHSFGDLTKSPEHFGRISICLL